MVCPAFDTLGAERWSAIGGCPLIVTMAAAPTLPPGAGPGELDCIVVGIDAAGELPMVDESIFDALLTTAAHPPAPWVFLPQHRFHQQVSALVARISANPVAATTLVALLRMGEHSAVESALLVESLAYSTLLGGQEFANWLERREPVAPSFSGEVRLEREADRLTVELASPETRNAMTARMRDELFEALANALDDPSAPRVALHARGKCFSTGGDLAEFGTSRDLALAHVIRTRRSAARLIMALGKRASVLFHGAVIGSGLEPFAGAEIRMARRNAWFQLPELAMGLIPGAGGTVTVPRAIGRHRAGYLMLSGCKLRASDALAWGLVNGIAN